MRGLSPSTRALSRGRFPSSGALEASPPHLWSLSQRMIGKKWAVLTKQGPVLENGGAKPVIFSDGFGYGKHALVALSTSGI
ncbi:hypothetical protein NDU88_002033 [Pleurodeles waltl]|uniref:Uncharacterized protein n=1 Tax=Pleurodeles waltl TaxID=8319 RepID=A0AAV7M4U6_PLEWA|nr:hypothetical protein NDU88_002033 [Pleurodeles waltl]